MISLNYVCNMYFVIESLLQVLNVIIVTVDWTTDIAPLNFIYVALTHREISKKGG